MGPQKKLNITIFPSLKTHSLCANIFQWYNINYLQIIRVISKSLDLFSFEIRDTAVKSPIISGNELKIVSLARDES
jgi:hypothetical protein